MTQSFLNFEAMAEAKTQAVYAHQGRSRCASHAHAVKQSKMKKTLFSWLKLTTMICYYSFFAYLNKIF